MAKFCSHIPVHHPRYLKHLDELKSPDPENWFFETSTSITWMIHLMTIGPKRLEIFVTSPPSRRVARAAARPTLKVEDWRDSRLRRQMSNTHCKMEQGTHQPRHFNKKTKLQHTALKTKYLKITPGWKRKTILNQTSMIEFKMLNFQGVPVLFLKKSTFVWSTEMMIVSGNIGTLDRVAWEWKWWI